jgi:hypothetical protein
MGRLSHNPAALGVLTVVVLLAAVAVWTYNGRSDSSGDAAGASPAKHLADLTIPGTSTKPKPSSNGHRANGTVRRHAPRTKPATSGPVTPIRAMSSGPVPAGPPQFPPQIRSRPVKTSPVSRQRPRQNAGPRTLPPHRAPERPAPGGGGPFRPIPAPTPAPAPKPSPPTGGAPNTTPPNPGGTPTAPGATPTNPGTPPTQPIADPDAGLDDTAAGGLDQTDLGGPIDETPDPAAATGGTG